MNRIPAKQSIHFSYKWLMWETWQRVQWTWLNNWMSMLSCQLCVCAMLLHANLSIDVSRVRYQMQMALRIQRSFFFVSKSLTLHLLTSLAHRNCASASDSHNQTGWSNWSQISDQPLGRRRYRCLRVSCTTILKCPIHSFNRVCAVMIIYGTASHRWKNHWPIHLEWDNRFWTWNMKSTHMNTRRSRWYGMRVQICRYGIFYYYFVTIRVQCACVCIIMIIIIAILLLLSVAMINWMSKRALSIPLHIRPQHCRQRSFIAMAAAGKLRVYFVYYYYICIIIIITLCPHRFACSHTNFLCPDFLEWILACPSQNT